MTNKSILIREQDKKVFKVKFLSHWSSIVSDDNEIDTVKCLDKTTYISMNKGFSYKILEESKEK